MTKFFSSDFHISHKLVVGLRGYGREDGTVDHEAYEADLAADWDSRVKKDDQVFLLGDLALNPNKGAFEWLSKRPGRIIFIAGNHDKVHPLHSSWMVETRKWMGTGIFEVIASQGSVKIAGQKVLLSHFPYTGEGDRDQPDRYEEWRFRDEGLPLCHGHEHKARTLEESLPHQFHVGLDSHNLQLVHELEIEDWLEGRAANTSF